MLHTQQINTTKFANYLQVSNYQFNHNSKIQELSKLSELSFEIYDFYVQHLKDTYFTVFFKVLINHLTVFHKKPSALQNKCCQIILYVITMPKNKHN